MSDQPPIPDMPEATEEPNAAIGSAAPVEINSFLRVTFRMRAQLSTVVHKVHRWVVGPFQIKPV